MFAYARRPALAGIVALAGLAGLATIGPAGADPLSIRVNGWTNAPVGYLDFCRSAPQECRAGGGVAAPVLDEDGWRELQDINRTVNRVVIPATDLAFHATEELWAIPDAYGDCEDYVLLKRKLLADRGWPTGALLITVVFDEFGDGHAVLLVRTDRGDLVLDNKTDAIRDWQETAYRYVKRQSVDDPNRWVSLGDSRWSARSTAANR